MTKLDGNPEDSGSVGTNGCLQRKGTTPEEDLNKDTEILIVSVSSVTAAFSHHGFNFVFIHRPPWLLIPQITCM